MEEYNDHDVLDEDLSSLASAAEDDDEELRPLQSDADYDEENDDADNDDIEEDIAGGDSGADSGVDGDDDGVPDDDEEDGSGDDGEDGGGDSDNSADADEEDSVAANSDGDGDERETAADNDEEDDEGNEEGNDEDAMDVVPEDGEEETGADPAVKQSRSSPTTKKSPRTPVKKIAKQEGCVTDTDNEFEIAPEKDEFSLKDVGVDEASLDMKTGYMNLEEAAMRSPPRQSKRIAVRRPKSIYDENEYMMNTGKIATVTPSNGPPQAINFEPVRKYFLSRLCEFVVQNGGQEDAVADWTVEVNKRSGAIMGGLLDVTYVSPANKRHRSRVDSIITLGLNPYSKTIKHMSREEIADMAVENREKQLIAYQFDRLGSECLDIIREGDEITVIPLEKTTLPRVPEQVSTPVVTTTDTSSGDVVDVKMEVDEPAAVSGVESVIDVVTGVVEPAPVLAKPPKKLYFGFGNTTILEWGRITPSAMFHTKNQLYPIGFKCVRREHDILLDRPVDCYCEILSTEVQSVSTDAELTVDGTLASSGITDVIPLFRISICWLLGRGGNEKCVKVYEGKSPQLAWQAAMLETVGVPATVAEKEAAIKSEPAPETNGVLTGKATAVCAGGAVSVCDPVTVSAGAEVVAAPPSTVTVPSSAITASSAAEPSELTESEDMDDEEKALRKTLMETRKECMRVIRSAQLQGGESPVKPRLSLTTVDSFFDEGVLRLLEGMQGALECEEYEFVEMYSQESGFRGLTQAFSTTHANAKALQMPTENLCERVDLTQRFPDITEEEIENGGPIPMKPPARQAQNSGQSGSSKRRSKSKPGSAPRGSMKPLQPAAMKQLQSDINAKRHKNSADKQKEEALRQKKLSARTKLIAARKNRARDMEKMMRTVRESTLKSTVVRRSEARMLVESACDIEESEIRMKSSPFYTAKPVWRTAYAGCIDIAKGANTNSDHVATPHDDTDRPCVVPTALDASDLGVFRELEGDAVGELLEVWALVHSFASHMKLSKIPSPQVFLHSLLSCDHNYIQNSVSLSKTLNRLRDAVCNSTSSPGVERKKKDSADIKLSDPLELLYSLVPLDTPVIHQSEAESMLMELAIALCKMLTPEVHFWMGVDEAAGILGDVRPPVNSLTWKEVARVVLTSTLLQEVKGDMVNTATVLRGKGHTTAPDNFDKRTLRLSRKRIFAQGGGTDSLPHAISRSAAPQVVVSESDYSGYEKNKIDFISREKYRAICGRYATFKNFNSVAVAGACRQTSGYNGPADQALGICVRLPAPGGCHNMTEKRRQVEASESATHLIYSSARGSHAGVQEQSWEHVLSAVRTASDFDRVAVRRVLFSAIEMAISYAKKHPNTSKSLECIAVSRLLSELLKEEAGAKELKRKSTLILDSFPVESAFTPAEVVSPVSVLEAWEYQQRMKREPTATSIQPLDEEDACQLYQYMDAFEQATADAVSDDVIESSKLDRNDTIESAIRDLDIERIKLRLRYLFSLYQKETAQQESDDKVGLDITDESSGNDKAKDVPASASPDRVPAPASDLAESWEREQINTLPFAIRNCFNIIIELMVHPVATEFNYSVDINKFPEFYASIRRPLCFADIRQCLVENRYPVDKVLTSFYRDVMQVLENSLAFNPETDLITLSALKIGVVFERLFFEVALSVESTWMPEACIACRQVNCPNKGVVDVTEAVLCDRCDGAYHLSCVDPALDHLPRGDWYCPSCMHGKRVRDVHPCIGLLVHRPESKPSSFIGFSEIGRVVDFRYVGVSNMCVATNELQKRFTMQYVVMFSKQSRAQLFADEKEIDKLEHAHESASAGAAYELWSGPDVRRYCCRYATGDTTADSADPLPALPEGYTYGDYDEACTIARGYAGWSNLSPGLHPSLTSNCYLPMHSLLREDRDLALYQRALVALSPLSCSGQLSSAPVFGMAEWSSVLQALARRVISSQNGRDIAASLDEEATRSRTFSGSSISVVNLMCSLKGLFSGGPVVCDELVATGENDEEEGLMDALDDTSSDSESEEETEPQPEMVAQNPTSSAAEKNDTPKVELCDTDTDSEGEEERLEEKMLADEPFDESMLVNIIRDPRREWHSKRLSRRRGREDAYFTMQLLQELCVKVDAELAVDMDAERELLINLNGNDEKYSLDHYASRSSVFQTASRLFVNRPPDAVAHPDEWLRAWTLCHEENVGRLEALKLTVLEKANGAKAFKAGAEADSSSGNKMDAIEPKNIPTTEPVHAHKCQFCGYDEYTVGSTFVWGESRDEWNIATYGSGVYATNSFAQIQEELSIISECLTESFGSIDDLCNIWSGDHLSSQKRRKLYTLFLSALNKAGRKCAQNDKLNFETRKGDVVWAPLRPIFFNLEEEELHELSIELQSVEDDTVCTQVPTIRRGSLTVHECCAEYMNALRKSSATRLLRKNIVLLGEFVTSVKKGKVLPIGCDSFGNIYWMLPGLRTSIFICVPNKAGDPRSHYEKMFARENGGAGEQVPANFPPDYCAVDRCVYDDNMHWEKATSVGNASSLPFSRSVESPYGGTFSEDTCTWRVLNGILDIMRLVRWLKPDKYFCEKQLHVVLQLLYPEVMVVAQKSVILTEPNIPTLQKQTAAFERIWSQLENRDSDAGHESFINSLVGDVDEGGISREQPSDDQDDSNMDVDEDGAEEVEESVNEDAQDDNETQSEDDDEQEGSLSGRKRKRLSTGSKKKKNSESDSGEAEADFSDDDVAKSNKRSKTNKSETSSDESEDPYSTEQSKRGEQRKRPVSTGSVSSSYNRDSNSTANSSAKPRKPRGFIEPGTKVLVQNNSNELYWDAVVRKCFDFGNNGLIYNGYSGIFCYVHFHGWGHEYNSWVPVEEVQKQTPSKQILAKRQYKEYCAIGSSNIRSTLPSILLNLKSCQFLLSGGKGRWCGCNAVPGSLDGLQEVLSGIIPDMCAAGDAGDSSFNWGGSIVAGSSSHKDVRLLKTAMLLLEASLPEKCVDTSDERWGDVEEGFSDYWRATVVSATDAATLMECQILLEFSVRTAWLSAAGAKLLTCMPSRTHATRFATYGLVAMRVLSLDEAVRYELAKRRPDPTGPGSEDEDDGDDDDSWSVPAVQGSSTRPNAVFSRDKSGGSKGKAKKSKKRR